MVRVFAGETLPVEPGADIVPLYALETLFGNVVSVVLALSGIALFIMLVVGGFRYITAGGDPKGIEAARNTLTYAIFGVVLLAASYMILVFIQAFTGVELGVFRVYIQ